MLYVVATKILRALIPEDQAAELVHKEMVHARQFIEQKKILAAYRRVGGGGSFFIVDAESNEEVHQIFSGLPLARYLEFDVTPVLLHPLFGGLA